MKKLTLNLLKIIFAALVIGCIAQVEIELPEHLLGISITGQTFVVLFMAYILKKEIAIATILCYLLLGLIGLPVFASFSSGWEKFTGPSLGYFVGFVLSTLYIAFQKRKSDSLFKIFNQFIIATIIILFSGFIGLLNVLSPMESFRAGVQPFIIGGIVKAILAVFAVYLHQFMLTSLAKWRKT